MKWVRLRRADHCAFGCDISRGAQALIGRRHRRQYGRRFVVCREHAAAEYGMQPPPLEADELIRDGRAIAARNDE